jgi:hypothetical protein
MVLYTCFNGQGQTVLADEFGVEDPFGMSPADIVDRVVGLGYKPWIEAHQPRMLPGFGFSTQIEREGLTYIVFISRDTQEIDVQEQRHEAYDSGGVVTESV